MNDPSRFSDALLAAGPTIAVSAQLFAPLIGSWDLVVRWFDEGGGVMREEGGEWHFAWVLDGRGVQDVWIVPRRGQRQAERNYEYGTSIRFYDETLDAWRSTWIGPAHGVVHTFLARAEGERIVMQITPGATPRMRWSFEGITEAGFRWRNEVFEDGLWRVQQDFVATRAPAG